MSSPISRTAVPLHHGHAFPQHPPTSSALTSVPPRPLAVYIPAPAGSAAAAQCEQLATQHAAAHIAAHPAQPLTLSLLYASHNAREGAAMVTLPGHRVTPDESLTYQQLYPINALRNLAIEAAGTPLVLFTEGDFLPSRGLCEELGTPGTQVGRRLGGGGGGGQAGGWAGCQGPPRPQAPHASAPAPTRPAAAGGRAAGAAGRAGGAGHHAGASHL